MTNVHQVDSNPLLRIFPARQDRNAPARDAQNTEADPTRVDRVDLSDNALNISNLSARGEIRADLVARVRSEIASGTYVTNDKIDATVDSIASELGG
jgi:anti-sigma28 factor (negative regulator of flagellin synthesis)